MTKTAALPAPAASVDLLADLFAALLTETLKYRALVKAKKHTSGRAYTLANNRYAQAAGITRTASCDLAWGAAEAAEEGRAWDGAPHQRLTLAALNAAEAAVEAAVSDAPSAAVEASDGPVIEHYTCRTCGADFSKTRTRGRKPTQCPKCKEA